MGLRLARVVQIRDAIFIRRQNEMYLRHHELEWVTKRLASTIVSSAPFSDQKGISKAVDNIAQWDMDQVADDDTVDTSEVDMSSEEAIEAMWAKGADEAMTRNMSKPSFGSQSLGGGPS